MSIRISFKGWRPPLTLHNVVRVFPVENGILRVWIGEGDDRKYTSFEDVYYISPA